MIFFDPAPCDSPEARDRSFYTVLIASPPPRKELPIPTRKRIESHLDHISATSARINHAVRPLMSLEFRVRHTWRVVFSTKPAFGTFDIHCFSSLCSPRSHHLQTWQVYFTLNLQSHSGQAQRTRGISHAPYRGCSQNRPPECRRTPRFSAPGILQSPFCTGRSLSRSARTRSVTYSLRQ